MSESKNESTGARVSARQPWAVPVCEQLPPLTELTLQTGGAIGGGGGTGGGTVF